MESFLAPVLTAFAIISTYAQLTYTLIATTVNQRVAAVQCEKAGSEFLTRCDGASFACVKKFPDAGVPCTTTSLTCQGFCVKKAAGEGVCSAYPLPKHTYDQFQSSELEIALSPPTAPASLTIPAPCPAK